MDNFEYKKSFGQNFINDENIINKIVNYAGIDSDTLVIEIGPGAGSLSKKIIPLSKITILYEIDIRLKEILDKELGKYNNYKIIFNDVLKQEIKKDISSYKYKKLFVVANLPYYITTPILTKVIEEVCPDKIIVMVQDEVANRLCALPKNKEYGMITVMLGAIYDIKKLFKVNRNCFKPVPNVDSAVISLVKHNKYFINSNILFNKFIGDAFRYKRKTLKNNLRGYDFNKLSLILEKHGYSLKSRAEEIPVDVYVDIVNNYY